MPRANGAGHFSGVGQHSEMTALGQARRLRNPTVLIIFLFISAVAHIETPENFQLRDDVSNDIAFIGSERHSLPPCDLDGDTAPTLERGQFKVSAGTVQVFRFPSAAEPFRLFGQDPLLLWSIQRI